MITFACGKQFDIDTATGEELDVVLRLAHCPRAGRTDAEIRALKGRRFDGDWQLASTYAAYMEGPVPRAEWPEGCLELLNYSRHRDTREHTLAGSLHLTHGPLFEVARFATATGWAEYVRGGGGEWFKEKWCDDDDLKPSERVSGKGTR